LTQVAEAIGDVADAAGDDDRDVKYCWVGSAD
jgi:hypothetical protein